MPEKIRIHLLPPELQNQIAAGEVVERPASVLKELVENALDAGATRLRMEIRDGGQSFLQISDNGAGMTEEDLELALTRHATSKLATLQDLQNIHTFGFRGEALPSIASVARFRLSSAPADGEGAFLEVLHGRITQRGKVAMPRGTNIEVSDLFSNVPARLKFLKQPATEARKCADLALRLALANPDVDFEFISAGREVFRFLAGQSLEQRLQSAWPHELIEKTHTISLQDGECHVSGLAGDPTTAQARADRLLLYVNARPVQDKTIVSAIREAYRGRILGREYPQAVLFLHLPPHEVDVNVHPAKTEVRFQDEGAIFRLIRRAVLQALDRDAGSVFVQVDKPAATPPAQSYIQIPVSPEAKSTVQPERVREGQESYDWPKKFESSKIAQALFAPPTPKDMTPSTLEVPHPPAPKTVQQTNAPSYLGQVARTYLILATEDDITLMDQHAAHEKVLFHMLRTSASRGDRQPLLVPLEMHLHPSQVVLVQEIWADLDTLGFSLDLSTPPKLLIQAIPTLLPPAQARGFLTDALLDKAKTMEDLWAVMACKSAIKAGDALTANEALALIESWHKVPDKNYCPHGRPVCVRWGKTELEKLFKRRA